MGLKVLPPPPTTTPGITSRPVGLRPQVKMTSVIANYRVVADESFLGQGSCFYYTTTDGGTIQDTDCTLAKEGACGGMCSK